MKFASLLSAVALAASLAAAVPASDSPHKAVKPLKRGILDPVLDLLGGDSSSDSDTTTYPDSYDPSSYDEEDYYDPSSYDEEDYYDPSSYDENSYDPYSYDEDSYPDPYYPDPYPYPSEYQIVHFTWEWLYKSDYAYSTTYDCTADGTWYELDYAAEWLDVYIESDYDESGWCFVDELDYEIYFEEWDDCSDYGVIYQVCCYYPGYSGGDCSDSSPYSYPYPNSDPYPYDPKEDYTTSYSKSYSKAKSKAKPKARSIDASSKDKVKTKLRSRTKVKA